MSKMIELLEWLKDERNDIAEKHRDNKGYNIKERKDIYWGMMVAFETTKRKIYKLMEEADERNGG